MARRLLTLGSAIWPTDEFDGVYERSVPLVVAELCARAEAGKFMQAPVTMCETASLFPDPATHRYVARTLTEAKRHGRLWNPYPPKPWSEGGWNPYAADWQRWEERAAQFKVDRAAYQREAVDRMRVRIEAPTLLAHDREKLAQPSRPDTRPWVVSRPSDPHRTGYVPFCDVCVARRWWHLVTDLRPITPGVEWCWGCSGTIQSGRYVPLSWFLHETAVPR